MTDISELQGEVTTLRCFVAALATTLALSSQIRLWPAFKSQADLVRDKLGREALRGFEPAMISLSSKRAVAG